MTSWKAPWTTCNLQDHMSENVESKRVSKRMFAFVPTMDNCIISQSSISSKFKTLLVFPTPSAYIHLTLLNYFIKEAVKKSPINDHLRVSKIS